MCDLCMSSALGDWQAFEGTSIPDVVSIRSEFAQLVSDAGLADLAELFPAVQSFADIVARLQEKQAGADNWTDLIERLFEATDTSFTPEHDFALDATGTGLSVSLNQLRQLMGDQDGGSVDDDADLQPMYAGTVEGGTASGSPVGFNEAMADFIDSGSYWFDFDTDIEIAETISFGFTTSNSFAAGYGEQSGWSAFTSSQRDVAREIMGLWDDLIAPSFVEDTGSPNTADIKFSNSTTDTGFAHAYYPGQVGVDTHQFQKIQGSVWLNPNFDSGVNNLVSPDSGDYGFTAIAHEVGHALGLNHAGNYNGGSPAYGNGSTGWLYDEDSNQYTIMSYFDESYTGAAWGGQNAQTPMVYDILAIQQMYGADYTTRAGDTTYGFNSTAANWIYDYTQNTAPVMTIWDGDGTDTIDLSGWSTSSTLSLAAGSYSSVNNMIYNLAIAYDVDIENAIGGSGDDTLNGNDLDNVITGNSGNDIIKGHLGSDTLYGGEGNDLVEGEGLDARDHYDAQAFRMYQAALDRAPDGNGLEFWSSNLLDGTETVLTMANGFVTSAEFVSTYGSLNNDQFVNLLYNNVLDRDADTDGLTFWLSELAAGSTRAEVVVGFSESREFIASAQETNATFLSSGTPVALTDDIYRLYQATLDRDPDAPGLLGWLDGLGAGVFDKVGVAENIIASSEFQSVYGALDDSQFVSLLYNNVLDRDPDSGGLSFWLDAIDAGTTRAEVVLGFSDSLEFVDNTEVGANAWVRSVDLGNDVLFGGADNDRMFGGLGADTFVFDSSLDGIDFVGDLESWDTLVFNDFNYSTKEDALAHFTQVGGDAVFADQGNTVTFYNTNFADLDHADMFKFDDTSFLS